MEVYSTVLGLEHLNDNPAVGRFMICDCQNRLDVGYLADEMHLPLNSFVSSRVLFIV